MMVMVMMMTVMVMMAMMVMVVMVTTICPGRDEEDGVQEQAMAREMFRLLYLQETHRHQELHSKGARCSSTVLIKLTKSCSFEFFVLDCVSSQEHDIYCAGCYEDKFATKCIKCNKVG